MATSVTTPVLAPHLRSLLSGLRWRIRWYVWLEGLLLALIWLALTFWVALALDYLPVLMGASEMPREARAVVLAVIATGLAWILYRWIVERTWVRLGDRSMALLLERRFGSFHDSLITAVELSGRSGHDDYDPVMLERTHAAALSRSSDVRLGRIFNYRPLLTKLLTALILFLPAGILLAMESQAFQLGINRLYFLDNEPWPRWAQIAVVGIEVERETTAAEQEQPTRFVPFQDRSVKVAKGSSVHLQVRAAAGDHVVPDVCTVYYTTEQQERGRVQMTKVGRVRDGAQQFFFDGKPFRGILGSVTFDVVGYDHRVRDYHIEVVENPVIVETTLDMTFPEYLVDPDLALWLPRQGVDWTPGTQLPRGTQLTIRARSNKPLKEVLIRDVATGETTTVEMTSGDRRQLQYQVPALEQNLSLELTLHDTDDVVSQRPHRIFIAAVEDEPPQIDVVLQGIREAITPQARIPVTGHVRDDHRVDRTWFEVRVNDQPPRDFPLPLEPAGAVQSSLDFRDLRSLRTPLTVQPADRVALTVRASDRHDLAGGKNIGKGDTYQLSVVTPDELLVMLERRELALRQRFEVIIVEVEQMRDSLAQIPATIREPDDMGAEPGEQQLSEQDHANRARSLRLLRAQQAALQSQKSSQEILGVAAAFDEIREELMNNRVDAEDKQARLKEQISDPLTQVSREQFPKLDEILEQLQMQIADPQASAERGDQAIEQTVVILAELERILQRMIELESYNELIGLVRDLIEEHENVMERTKDERKQQILDLLN